MPLSLIHTSRQPLRAYPGAIPWIFVGIIACLLALALYGSWIFAMSRTFVAAESHWAKAQRDATFYLSRFAASGDPEDYAAFRSGIAVLEGARAARIELTRTEPDMALVREQLRSARVTESEIDGLLFLSRRLGGYEPSLRLASLWRDTDVLVSALRAEGTRLYEGGEGTLGAANIARLHQAFGAQEAKFARTLGEMQRTAQWLVIGGIFVLTTVLLAAGISVSRRFLRQAERLHENLTESEGQLRTLVETAPLPLMIVRLKGQRILYANSRALEQFAFDLPAALAHSLAEFHLDPASRSSFTAALSRRGSVRDCEVHLRDARGREMWLLLSAEPLRYGGEVCLLVALADIDERKRLQEDMRRKAMHDPLTGLPNRAMFMESLERAAHKARRRAARFSVLFIDLDRFKEVNDTMGHHAGDLLLKEVSERLCAAVRASDLVARLAGDEFVVLVEEQGSPEEVMIVGQKVLAALAQPVTIDWRDVAISGSIGIASFPDDGADVASLVKSADLAMYQAKERGRNNFQFYSQEQNDLSRRRLEQERRVLGAIERGELFLEYQPEVDIETRAVVAVEALLRWRDPDAGVVLPTDFMPLAEEAGASPAIGAWVLDRALGDLRAWRERGLDLKLAVNLSARQLRQADLVQDVARLLELNGVEPFRLRLEITEPTLMIDSDAARRTLHALKELGVEMAIDNFGTGYSALGLVRALPIQVVKIDRSLVSACPTKRECAAIVQAAAAMARALGIRVVAEGVETAEQLATVQALGCDALQGYYLARPVDAAGIAATMRAVAEQTLLA